MTDGSGDTDRDGFSDLEECPSTPCNDADGDLLPDYADADTPNGTGRSGASSNGAVRTSTFQGESGSLDLFALLLLGLAALGLRRR